MQHICDWEGCKPPREHGFVYCTSHLTAEYERWLQVAEDDDTQKSQSNRAELQQVGYAIRSQCRGMNGR